MAQVAHDPAQKPAQAAPKPHIMDIMAVPLSLQLLLNEELSGRRRPAMVKSLQIAIDLTIDMDCSEEHLG